MDLNRLLLFLAVASPLVILWQARTHPEMDQRWRRAAWIVLALTAVSLVLARNIAGFIGTGAWFGLLALPALISRRLARVSLWERTAAARRWADLLCLLQPGQQSRAQARLFRALEVAEAGNSPQACTLLDSIPSESGAVHLRATAEIHRLRYDWAGLVGWARTLPIPTLLHDPFLLMHYFRALGESGSLPELTQQFVARAHVVADTSEGRLFLRRALVPVLAFTGLESPLERILPRGRKGLPRETQEFWRATCLLASGEISLAQSRLRALSDGAANRLVREDARTRLSRNLVTPADAFGPGASGIIGRLQTLANTIARDLQSATAFPIGVAVILCANLLVFGLEVVNGGSQNYLTLYRLGALEPIATLRGEYWRLGSAMFLHYGFLHLLLNTFALLFIGPSLERLFGTVRFLFCYLLAGVLSTTGVLLLRVFGLIDISQLVGASGAVMGLVGVWIGYLLHHRHSPFGRRRLSSLGMVVVIQIFFDVSTPQISLAAHLSGLLAGIVLGYILPPAKDPCHPTVE